MEMMTLKFEEPWSKRRAERTASAYSRNGLRGSQSWIMGWAGGIGSGQWRGLHLQIMVDFIHHI